MRTYLLTINIYLSSKKLCFITRLSKNDHVYEWTDPFLFFPLRRCKCNTSMQSLVNNLTDGRINDICPNTYKSYSLVGIVKTHKILSYIKMQSRSWIPFSGVVAVFNENILVEKIPPPLKKKTKKTPCF